MEAFVVSFLLSLSSFLGVQELPSDVGQWQTSGRWENIQGQDVFSAASLDIIDQCKKNPNQHISFPLVIHGVHRVFLDSQLIMETGDATFNKASPFYQNPTLPCLRVAGGESLRWSITSYSRYFSRFSKYPVLTKGSASQLFFPITLNIMGAGVLAVFALFSFLIFSRRISNGHCLSISLGSLLISGYFFASVNSYFGIEYSMLLMHKFADVCLWLGALLFLNAFCYDGVLSRRPFHLLAVSVGLSLVIIIWGNSPDTVQFGTLIPLPAVLICEASILIRLIFSRGQKYSTALNALALGFLVSASYNDFLVIVGVSATPLLLPIGMIGGNLSFAFAVNRRIEGTYDERDSLLKGLESKVKEKTKDLREALADLKTTQAELVQSARLASLGTLSAGIAHEINNAINYVNGALRPLERKLMKISDPKDREILDKLFAAIKDGTQLTVNIVRSLRDYTGLNQAPQKNIRVLEVVESVLTILKSRLRSTHVQVQVNPQLNVFVNVVGINQVLMNLITNAIDAVPSSEGSIVIEAFEDGAELVLKVSDNGHGMSDEVIKRIFDPFFTTKAVGSGTGLGMHIVFKEVERMGGQIKVESEIDHGTEFTIRFAKIQQEVAA